MSKISKKEVQMTGRKLGISTLAIHGEIKESKYRSVVYPIYQSSTFAVKRSDDYDRFVRGDEDFYIYSRYGNPTVREVEKRICAVESGEDAIIFSSGMSAIASTALSLLESGDEIIALSSIYGVTYRFFRDYLPKYGIKVNFVTIDEIYNITDGITDRTKFIYFETPVNPTTRLVDIEKLVKIAEMGKILTIIDNTFATPVNQNPLDFGVDIVIHSATKYLSGHSDLILGCCICSHELARRIRETRNILGFSPDPYQVFLLGRSLKTLELRVKKQNENALKLAKYLNSHPRIRSVLYPGLESHPEHELALRQMRGFGGILSFELEGGLDSAKKFCDSLKIALNATSLGSVETLVSIPVLTSHIKLSEAELRQAGVSDSMVRVSVGVENIDDLIDDFEQALRSI